MLYSMPVLPVIQILLLHLLPLCSTLPNVAVFFVAAWLTL